MDVDFDRVEKLLSVAEKCTGHSGKLSNLQNAAIKELTDINEKIKAQSTSEANKAAEAQQKASGLPAQPGVTLQPKAIPSDVLEPVDEPTKSGEDAATDIRRL